MSHVCYREVGVAGRSRGARACSNPGGIGRSLARARASVISGCLGRPPTKLLLLLTAASREQLRAAYLAKSWERGIV
jgi:hypothetical protein